MRLDGVGGPRACIWSWRCQRVLLSQFPSRGNALFQDAATTPAKNGCGASSEARCAPAAGTYRYGHTLQEGGSVNSCLRVLTLKSSGGRADWNALYINWVNVNGLWFWKNVLKYSKLSPGRLWPPRAHCRQELGTRCTSQPCPLKHDVFVLGSSHNTENDHGLSSGAESARHGVEARPTPARPVFEWDWRRFLPAGSRLLDGQRCGAGFGAAQSESLLSAPCSVARFNTERATSRREGPGWYACTSLLWLPR